MKIEESFDRAFLESPRIMREHDHADYPRDCYFRIIAGTNEYEKTCSREDRVQCDVTLVARYNHLTITLAPRDSTLTPYTARVTIEPRFLRAMLAGMHAAERGGGE